MGSREWLLCYFTYIVFNGCEWNKSVCAGAAAEDFLHVLQ
jgi:hypothetical protein